MNHPEDLAEHRRLMDAERRDALAFRPAQYRALTVTVRFQNDNPNTIWNRLAAQLGREPTNAEARAEVKRILAEAGVQK